MNVAPQGATCAVHLGTAAPFLCERCGRYCCDACADFGYDAGVQKMFCKECFARVAAQGSSQAVTALVLALIGLQCGMLFLGIPAVILGHAQLAAFRRGEVNQKSASLAKGAVILGWIDIALLVIALIALVAFIASGGLTRSPI